MRKVNHFIVSTLNYSTITYNKRAIINFYIRLFHTYGLWASITDFKENSHIIFCNKNSRLIIMSIHDFLKIKWISSKEFVMPFKIKLLFTLSQINSYLYIYVISKFLIFMLYSTSITSLYDNDRQEKKLKLEQIIWIHFHKNKIMLYLIDIHIY